ncbi:MAG TPA: hypothetical protein VFM34_13485 [Moraxellaceae bacterium]|nr:hypothetical protein [Moraxellaceae bacterium]
MVSSADILRQRLPAQDLGRLTLVSHQPRKLREWVEQLPMINVGDTSRQVFQTVQELARLQVDPATRLELLEILRPVVHTLCRALSKHYLGQSVVLPERATKVATLAQSMQSHLAVGYKLVALATFDKLGQKREPEQVRVAALALHRAVSELTDNLLRSTQLYLNTPPRLWLELHSLYLGAVELQLAGIPLPDPVLHRQVESSTIEQAYVRALLLATCKANKLRQNEIAQIHQLADLWAPLVTLREIGGTSELFVFDLSRDAPPTYRTLAQPGSADHVRAIDPSRLVARLGELRLSAPGVMAKAHGEASLSASLLQHLVQAWSELSERSFSRVAAEGTLHACLGLTALHYFLSGGRDFETMMRGDQGRYLVSESDNPFLKAKTVEHRPDDRQGKDVWALAFGSGVNEKTSSDYNLKFQEKVDSAPRYDVFSCQIVNMSPGGYCIEWSGDVPSGVRAGEILGLREESQPAWSIGVIRWVKQLPGHGAQLGIEVLAPKAKPCGARVIKKTGDSSEYMRTLMLPELKSIGRPATLITPALTFRSGYKVGLNIDGEEVKIHLSRQVAATPSFCQFEFSQLHKPAAGQDTRRSSPGGDEEDFDSIWASL